MSGRPLFFSQRETERDREATQGPAERGTHATCTTCTCTCTCTCTVVGEAFSPWAFSSEKAKVTGGGRMVVSLLVTRFPLCDCYYLRSLALRCCYLELPFWRSYITYTSLSDLLQSLGSTGTPLLARCTARCWLCYGTVRYGTTVCCLLMFVPCACRLHEKLRVPLFESHDFKIILPNERACSCSLQMVR
jgi:hypothetical protein